MSRLTLRPARTMWEKACTATGSVTSKKMVARPIASPRERAPNREMHFFWSKFALPLGTDFNGPRRSSRPRRVGSKAEGWAPRLWRARRLTTPLPTTSSRSDKCPCCLTPKRREDR